MARNEQISLIITEFSTYTILELLFRFLLFMHKMTVATIKITLRTINTKEITLQMFVAQTALPSVSEQLSVIPHGFASHVG